MKEKNNVNVNRKISYGDILKILQDMERHFGMEDGGDEQEVNSYNYALLNVKRRLGVELFGYCPKCGKEIISNHNH